MHIFIAVLHRPTKPTGVCRHAANLARCLADADEVTKITLVTGTWQRDYFEKGFSLLSEKINIIDIDIENKSVSRNLWLLWGLPKLVKQLAPDLVHLAFPLPFFRYQFSCPVITTIHDLYAFNYPENFGKIRAFFNRAFFQQCLRGSDGLLCVSQATQDQLFDYFPNYKHQQSVKVVYNYVDFNHITATAPHELVGEFPRSFLLCVAQHRKNKNLKLLVDAFAYLRNANSLPKSTILFLVGSPGPETDTLCKQVIALGLEESVVFLSAITDGQLRWLYQHCKLFVIPSSVEGFCIPLVEALYLGANVLCSDIPIFREIGSSHCTYFDLEKNSTQNLIDAIRLTLNCSRDIKPDFDLRFLKLTAKEHYLKFYLNIING